MRGQSGHPASDTSESEHPDEALKGDEESVDGSGSIPPEFSDTKSDQQTGSNSRIATEPSSSDATIQKPAPAQHSSRQSGSDRPNPFSGASQFFSFRGLLAGASLFLLTLSVCVLAIGFVWSLGISLLFTVAISTGHLVFYTRDRHVRERVYFGCVALGTFLGGALFVDLQLTHPYFINHRALNALTSELVDTLESDSRFTNIEVSTKIVQEPVAGLTGTVRTFEDRAALRILVEGAGFVIATFEVRVADESRQHTSRSSADKAPASASG